jgi:hypothetical protein
MITICLILLLLFVTPSFYYRNDTRYVMEKGANQNLTQNNDIYRIENVKIRTHYNDEADFIVVEGEQDEKVYEKCDNAGFDCTINQPNVAVIGKYLLLIRYHGIKARKARSQQLQCYVWVQMFSTKPFFCP